MIIKLTSKEAANFIGDWLDEEKYRIVQHRHNDTFRAIDQAAGMEWNAESLASLAIMIIQYQANSVLTTPP